MASNCKSHIDVPGGNNSLANARYFCMRLAPYLHMRQRHRSGISQTGRHCTAVFAASVSSRASTWAVILLLMLLLLPLLPASHGATQDLPNAQTPEEVTAALGMADLRSRTWGCMPGRFDDKTVCVHVHAYACARVCMHASACMHTHVSHAEDLGILGAQREASNATHHMQLPARSRIPGTLHVAAGCLWPLCCEPWTHGS